MEEQVPHCPAGGTWLPTAAGEEWRGPCTAVEVIVGGRWVEIVQVGRVEEGDGRNPFTTWSG